MTFLFVCRARGRGNVAAERLCGALFVGLTTLKGYFYINLGGTHFKTVRDPFQRRRSNSLRRIADVRLGVDLRLVGQQKFRHRLVAIFRRPMQRRPAVFVFFAENEVRIVFEGMYMEFENRVSYIWVSYFLIDGVGHHDHRVGGVIQPHPCDREISHNPRVYSPVVP
jgi:hypothetical protein